MAGSSQSTLPHGSSEPPRTRSGGEVIELVFVSYPPQGLCHKDESGSAEPPRRPECARSPSTLLPHALRPGPPRIAGAVTATDGHGRVAIVGGCGHVGLPLGLAFASRGLEVVLYDVAERSVALVNDGVMPFDEPGAPEVLPTVLASGHLRATTSADAIADAEHVIVVIGTPIDEHLNPDLNAVPGGHRRHRVVVARRSAARAAQHRVPRGHRAGRAAGRRPRSRHRRRVLPGAHRRGQGDGRAVRAPADRRLALTPRARACEQVVPQPRATRSSSSNPKKRSSRSSSRTRGATSSSRRPTSST